ncbi:MAG: N-6 DNA methylase [Termitinemataceae bacterium]|nr:MAG: N-6 DNA methylase [Termitinemataceae bacterium]
MPLAWNEIRIRAAEFAERWGNDHSVKERAEAQTFQNEFMRVFGLDRKKVALFEKEVFYGDGQGTLFGDGGKGSGGRMDMFWPGVLLSEMKRPGEDLEEAFIQARKYALSLPPRLVPKGILICDFFRFEYYNLEKDGEKTAFTLAELPQYVELFGFIAGYHDTVFQEASPVDIEAAERMACLHEALKETGYEGHDLEVYLVRLLFCLFADDTGIFGEKKVFSRYITERTAEDGSDLALHIERIFDTLNRHPDKRSKAIDEQLNRFPYVDGGIFGERLTPADFTSKMRRTLLDCCAMDWGRIKPEIFGAMFQNVMKPEQRRALGEHYTSEANILKIIKPLFLDELQAELDKIKKMRSGEKKHRLLEFHDKLCRLKFLDPACGCGNFLIVSYRALRELEIETIKEILKGEQILDIEMIVRVNVDQFFGIEIEEFPVQVARTAMWLMDHLMNNAASAAFGKYIARFPLTTAAKIVHANAIPIDWETVCPKAELSYILGNPPFVGANLMNKTQKKDLEQLFEGLSNWGILDYVTCWYKKAAQYIQDTDIECAFVSTNSICQGEQTPVLWAELMNKYHIKINFAHQTFKWWNEARGRAAVYCVIVGFGVKDRKEKSIFTYSEVSSTPAEIRANQINAYLLDANNYFILSRSSPVCEVSPMNMGSSPIDDGNFLLDEREKAVIIKEAPGIKKVIKPFIGAYEFLNKIPRYCIWLRDVSPAAYADSKEIRKRLEAVKKFRMQSKRSKTLEAAEFPMLFGEIRQSETDYLLIPRVSSEKRRYIPIGFFPKTVIAGDTCLVIPNATLYEFGIITSSMHMAWMRYICGRLEMRYRYSASIVYNNYPWPKPTDKQKEAIEKAAQAVLDTRAAFPDSSLAGLYDPLTMPPALVKAHQKLDKAVEKAYGKEFTNDADRVAYLFYLYQILTEGLIAQKTRRKNL